MFDNINKRQSNNCIFLKTEKKICLSLWLQQLKKFETYIKQVNLSRLSEQMRELYIIITWKPFKKR